MQAGECMVVLARPHMQEGGQVGINVCRPAGVQACWCACICTSWSTVAVTTVDIAVLVWACLCASWAGKAGNLCEHSHYHSWKNLIHFEYMFARPSYLRLSDSGEVMTTQRTSGASADLNDADASLGGEVREPFARDLAGEGGALRRLGLMCDSLPLST